MTDPERFRKHLKYEIDVSWVRFPSYSSSLAESTDDILLGVNSALNRWGKMLKRIVIITYKIIGYGYNALFILPIDHHLLHLHPNVAEDLDQKR